MDSVISIAGIEFILIPSGNFVSFQRGRPIRISITNQFYISKFPVTQKLWREYMPSLPWRKAVEDEEISESSIKLLAESDNCPAVCITLPEAIEFCEQFSSAIRCRCQLPTMAQWEYACRAGTETRYFWGDEEYNEEPAQKYAWFENSFSASKQPPELPQIGQLLPNPWGLYDIAGLVQEWVLDRHDMALDCEIPEHAFPDSLVDPLAMGGTHGICMGGGFRDPILSLNCSSYVVHTTTVRQVDIGFRLAMTSNNAQGAHT